MDLNMNAAAQSPNGAMYFGSFRGLNAFYPDRIFQNNYVPPVALTSLTSEGKPLAGQNLPGAPASIVLTWPVNSFEFEFTALSFADTAHNEYAYKLDGYDRQWNFLGNKRDGRFTNLPGGEYTLLLKAADSDGFWNEQPLTLSVKVVPPFWATLWFRVGAVIVALALIVIAIRLRAHQVVGRTRQLEALVRERTNEMEKLFERMKELAVVEERNRLARDLHDSAKQKAFAALAQLGAVNADMDGPHARKHLLEAENLVAEVIQELTFLIQEMYPVALMEKGLPVTVREYIFEWASRNDIETDVVIEAPQRLDLKVEQAIYRIIQEALANVARHSRACHVSVTLHYYDDHLDFSIVDDGCGFDSAMPPGIGIRSIRERVASIGGHVNFETEPGMGTSVRLTVPLVPHYFILEEGSNEKIDLHHHR
jgi:signal transduction histidine kinase